MKSKIEFRSLSGIIVLMLLMSSCLKEDPAAVEQDRAMRLSLEAFYTDTSVFHSVTLNNQIVSNTPLVIAGELNSLYQSPTGGLHFSDSTRIRVTVVKKSPPNLVFDSIVYLNNINEFLLLQLDRQKPPVFINKRLENATAVKPGQDSVKLRFFVSADEDFRSKIPGNPRATLLRLKMYVVERQPDGSYKKSTTVVQTINNIRLNELTPYYTFYAPDDKEYMFDLLDARSGSFTDAQRLIQKYDFDPDFFIDSYIGRLQKQAARAGLFQTARLTRSANLNGVRGINAVFLFGLD